MQGKLWELKGENRNRKGAKIAKSFIKLRMHLVTRRVDDFVES